MEPAAGQPLPAALVPGRQGRSSVMEGRETGGGLFNPPHIDDVARMDWERRKMKTFSDKSDTLSRKKLKFLCK